MLHERGHHGHHFGGLLSIVFHRAKSKSTDQLEDQQEKKLKSCQRAWSSRDLSFEHTKKEHPYSLVRKSSDSSIIAATAEANLQLKCSTPSVPFFVKYAVSTPKKQPGSAATMSARTSSPCSSITSDADVLDQALLHIRMKLVSITLL